jgi:hypothetical protein
MGSASRYAVMASGSPSAYEQVASTSEQMRKVVRACMVADTVDEGEASR